jgi:hypothetical protein
MGLFFATNVIMPPDNAGCLNGIVIVMPLLFALKAIIPDHASCLTADIISTIFAHTVLMTLMFSIGSARGCTSGNDIGRMFVLVPPIVIGFSACILIMVFISASRVVKLECNAICPLGEHMFVLEVGLTSLFAFTAVIPGSCTSCPNSEPWVMLLLFTITVYLGCLASELVVYQNRAVPPKKEPEVVKGQVLCMLRPLWRPPRRPPRQFILFSTI